MAMLAATLLASSCGYGFTPVGGIIPEGSRTIAILSLVNGTAEPYVDVEVTKAITSEFLADGRLKVVNGDSADLLLRGTITKFDVTPLSYTSGSYIQQYLVSIGLNVSIEDVQTHRMIWQEKGIGSVFVSSYAVAIGDISATKIAKETAIRSSSRDIASTIRSRVLEGF